jgi:nitrate/nitrite-specific signal transduction histidine kinase
MKKILQVLIVPFILLISTQAEEIKNTQQAINIAGKQRMLTQRMLADYVMIGMNSTFRDPKGDLSKVVLEFGTNLEDISAYSKEEEVTKKLSKVKAQWVTVKNQVQQDPSLDICKTLCADMDKLLEYSNDVVVAIKKHSAGKAGEIVDMSGRQRMLSQRIAGLYILNMWATHNDVYKKKLDDAMTLFKNSMETLKKYDKNTDEINTLIAKVEKSYGYLEKMRSVGSSMNTMPSLVYKKLDGMLTNMHKVTGLYASL